MALVQLIGGNIQDASGNVLDSGYLTLRLSHDEQDPSTGTQIAAGLPVKILLDNNGNAAVVQTVWATDVLLPTGAYYTVEAFKADGTLAWSAPQYLFVPSGSTYNLGNLIPNQPAPQIPSATIQLQTNGVNNSNQNLENLVAGTNITLTNVAGATTIAASGASSFSTAGSAVFYGGQTIGPPTIAGVTISNSSANTVYTCVLNLYASYTVRKIAFRTSSGSGASTFAVCAIYDVTGTTKLIDAGTNAFSTQNGNTVVVVTLGSPVVINAGSYILGWGGTATNTGTSSFGSPATSTGNISPALNAAMTAVGTATNTISAGAMPSSLGSISVNSSIDIPGFAFVV